MRTLVHLSDLHFGRVDDSLLEPLRKRVRAIAPNLLVVSGDLTQRARRTQFEQARDFLDTLPQPQLVVPGNHDVPLYNVVKRFVNPLKGYLRHITDDLDPFYADGEIAVAGVNTARSLTIKDGRINHEQVALLRERFGALDEGITKIVVTHHPFDLPAGNDNDDLVWRAGMAMKAFAECGADILLSGHMHLSHAGDTAARATRWAVTRPSRCRPARPRPRASAARPTRSTWSGSMVPKCTCTDMSGARKCGTLRYRREPHSCGTGRVGAKWLRARGRPTRYSVRCVRKASRRSAIFCSRSLRHRRNARRSSSVAASSSAADSRARSWNSSTSGGTMPAFFKTLNGMRSSSGVAFQPASSGSGLPQPSTRLNSPDAAPRAGGGRSLHPGWAWFLLSQPNSSCCGKSSVMVNHGALEPTKMCAVGRMEGGSTSMPQRDVNVSALADDRIQERAALPAMNVVGGLFAENQQAVLALHDVSLPARCPRTA